MSEEIIQKNASEAYVSDMVRYSIETNRRRAFPDYKDGLKLVQRRTLYAMAFLLPCSRELVKTAQVTGRVMGELHPHGDSSIDDVIKISEEKFMELAKKIYNITDFICTDYPSYKEWYFKKQIPRIFTPHGEILFARSEDDKDTILAMACLKKDEEEKKNLHIICL